MEILSQNCTSCKLRKVSIELPRLAVLASVHRTATVTSFDPRKKVRIELQTMAVLWTLFKTAIYGRCAQVSGPVFSLVWTDFVVLLFFLPCFHIEVSCIIELVLFLLVYCPSSPLYSLFFFFLLLRLHIHILILLANF